jgi:hypothetical protein
VFLNNYLAAGCGAGVCFSDPAGKFFIGAVFVFSIFSLSSVSLETPIVDDL